MGDTLFYTGSLYHWLHRVAQALCTANTTRLSLMTHQPTEAARTPATTHQPAVPLCHMKHFGSHWLVLDHLINLQCPVSVAHIPHTTQYQQCGTQPQSIGYGCCWDDWQCPFRVAPFMPQTTSVAVHKCCCPLEITGTSHWISTPAGHHWHS
jgi:hypothetical protein